MQLVPLSSFAGGAAAAEGATSLSVSSFGLIPFLLSNPWLLVLVLVIVARITAVLVLPVIAPDFSRRLFGVKKPPTTEKPYYPYDEEYEEYGEYGPGGVAGKRRRREIDSRKTKSAVPNLTGDQVESLTRLVFAAIESQECMQRLVCEAGSFSNAYSDSALSIARAVGDFVPGSLKQSYDIFTAAENCEKYSCGGVKLPSPVHPN